MSDQHETNGTPQDTQAELARLRAEVAKLTEERDGHRKSLVYILRKDAPPFDPAQCIPTENPQQAFEDLLKSFKEARP